MVIVAVWVGVGYRDAKKEEAIDGEVQKQLAATKGKLIRAWISMEEKTPPLEQ